MAVIVPILFPRGRGEPLGWHKLFGHSFHSHRRLLASRSGSCFRIANNPGTGPLQVTIGGEPIRYADMETRLLAMGCPSDIAKRAQERHRRSMERHNRVAGLTDAERDELNRRLCSSIGAQIAPEERAVREETELRERMFKLSGRLA